LDRLPAGSGFPARPWSQEFGFLDQQVEIGQSNVYSPRLEGLSILGQLAAEGFVPPQPVQERFSGAFRGHVLNDENRCGKIGGQLADHFIERFQASRGGPYDDDIASFA
jgi:hypothetical protein